MFRFAAFRRGHVEARLPDLRQLKGMDTYRHRPPHEYEEVVLKFDEVEHKAQVRLLSAKDFRTAASLPVYVRFVNRSESTVRTIWVDWEGHEVVYSVLKPNQSYVQKTWDHHAWIVRDVTDSKRLNLNKDQQVYFARQCQDADEVVNVMISEPPSLKWTEENHRLFPQDFKQEVRTLLLCHHKLSTLKPASKPTRRSSTLRWSCSLKSSPLPALNDPPQAHLGILPEHLVCLVMGHLVDSLPPKQLWQDSSKPNSHPSIRPALLTNRHLFRRMAEQTGWHEPDEPFHGEPVPQVSNCHVS